MRLATFKRQKCVNQHIFWMKVHFAEIVRLANLHLSSDDAKRILWGDIHTSRLAALHNIKCALLTHSGEKAHKCTRYNTSFSRTAHLKTHLLTHSGEKPHKCAECNKSFSRAGHLRTHLRTHSGKKPHKSTQCEKSFSQGAHLRTHLLAHSGEKVHMCTECNKSFSQAGDLKKHLLTHSGEKALQSPVYSMQQSIRSSGLLTLWTRPKSQKDGQNYKNTGVRRAFLPKCPSRRANPSLDGRLWHTDILESVIPSSTSTSKIFRH